MSSSSWRACRKPWLIWKVPSSVGSYLRAARARARGGGWAWADGDAETTSVRRARLPSASLPSTPLHQPASQPPCRQVAPARRARRMCMWRRRAHGATPVAGATRGLVEEDAHHDDELVRMLLPQRVQLFRVLHDSDRVVRRHRPGDDDEAVVLAADGAAKMGAEGIGGKGRAAARDARRRRLAPHTAARARSGAAAARAPSDAAPRGADGVVDRELAPHVLDEAGGGHERTDAADAQIIECVHVEAVVVRLFVGRHQDLCRCRREET